MERYAEEALVLSGVDYGEADRVITLFTRHRGKVSAFAAGARKSKRRFAGALEPGTHLKAQLVDRGGDVARLDGVDVLSSFHHLREDLPRIARAFYCLELARELTREREAHEDLLLCLLDYLGKLDRKEVGPTSLIKFELDSLMMAGFRPRFSSCVICDGVTGERPRFDPDAGGIVCQGCSYRVPGALPVHTELVAGLLALQQGKREPMGAELRAAARHLLNLFIAHHLGRTLNSVAFMQQMGTD